MRTWANVAKIDKVISQGEGFAISAIAGLPFVLAPGMIVQFVPPKTDYRRKATVSSVRMLTENSAEVQFSEIKSFAEGINYVGCFCNVTLSEVSQDKFAQPSKLLIGYSVIDNEFGELGLVDGIQGTPAQLCLSVSSHLIPFVEEFIIKIDVENETIYTNIPSGLWDL